MGLILDTNFIIAAEREAKRGSTALVDGFFADMKDVEAFGRVPRLTVVPY